LGATAEPVGASFNARVRRRLPIRLMIALLHFKRALNLSDEELCVRSSDNMQWQFFSGMARYEPCLPCDATQTGRFRRVLGEAGVEQLLKTTCKTALAMKLVKPAEFERVIVDTTVQEKRIARPSNSRLQSKSAPQGGQRRQARGHRRQADVCRARQTVAPQGRRLRARQAAPPLGRAPSSASARSWARSCAMCSAE
jgi:transposase, IS5 family